MISQKNKRQLNQVLLVAVVSLLCNLISPIPAAAANTRSLEITDSTIDTTPADDALPPIKSEVTPALPTITNKPVYKKIAVRSSAYSSTKDQTDNDPFTTASGTRVHDGTIATNGLPFGTKIRIPEYFGKKVFTVEDRMNGRWGQKKIDIWMTSRQQAQQWGVRTINIEILN